MAHIAGCTYCAFRTGLPTICCPILNSNFSLPAPIDDQVDRPTLIECIRFRGRKARINVPQEIGIKYYQFGLLLLEDKTGAKIDSIAHKHRDVPEQINMEILKEWTTGRGKHPVTWKTLVEVLHDIELSTLAGEIEALKCHEAVGVEIINNIPNDDPITER